jgi:HD superfamily phosphohydrolase
MIKNIHEIRDPIHVFVRLTSDERRVLDSKPFQRLRHIHQLALTYLVYPGATHKRFEHSLGVMELASRAYDIITDKDSLTDLIRNSVPELNNPDSLRYWRTVLRMAALCHDLGHLPFSHAAEKDLLPDADHEKLTVGIIRSPEMTDIWNSMTPPLRADDIAKLAVGPIKMREMVFSDWETVLSEIIVGDSFGVDRMDYLLRDSYHAGVAYGKFDHYRLIDTLRLLPSPPDSPKNNKTDMIIENHESSEPELGVTEGGLHSAEALLLAQYFIYSQVYFHPVRRIYDQHLKDFLVEWLPDGKFSLDIHSYLRFTEPLAKVFHITLYYGSDSVFYLTFQVLGTL